MLLLLHSLRYLLLTVTNYLLLQSFFISVDCEHSHRNLTLTFILLTVVVLADCLKAIVLVLAKYKLLVLPLVN